MAGRRPVGIAGDTALAEETVSEAGSDLRRIAPAALLVVVGILAVFLRALIAPLYLVAASVLALAVYLFQDVLGHGELTFYVLFAAAVLLVALGSDYNVFLAGRIWQEARRRPSRELAFTMGAGLLLDAFLVHTLLVPALITLFGRG